MQKFLLIKLLIISGLIGFFVLSLSLRKIDKYTPIIKSESIEIINKLKDLSLGTLNNIQENKDINHNILLEKIKILEDEYKEIVIDLNIKKVNKELRESIKYIRMAIVNYNLAVENIKSQEFQKSKNYLNFVNFYLNNAMENINRRSQNEKKFNNKFAIF
ncbi:MAG TPA: hypothetical protein PKW55_00840 [Spirochaetota bacterium]|nr:hypothetical protein [Spirochaetota bacterium]HOM39043.1 hypothetical protein [Spirochaetota bacterium]HPQ49904.1 hypothetical protein [Spirochaetota bacterium]